MLIRSHPSGQVEIYTFLSVSGRKKKKERNERGVEYIGGHFQGTKSLVHIFKKIDSPGGCDLEILLRLTDGLKSNHSNPSASPAAANVLVSWYDWVYLAAWDSRLVFIDHVLEL